MKRGGEEIDACSVMTALGQLEFLILLFSG